MAFGGGGAGLTEVPTEELERALRYVHRGDLPVPLEPHGIAACGLQHVLEPLLGHLRAVGEAGVKACLVAVIAERRAAERRRESRG